MHCNWCLRESEGAHPYENPHKINMGGCQNYGPFLGTLNIGITGTILGLYGDDGKENGNYYIGAIYHISPILITLNIRCCIIIGIQKGTIILTTTHITSALLLSLCSAPPLTLSPRFLTCKIGDIPGSRVHGCSRVPRMWDFQGLGF